MAAFGPGPNNGQPRNPPSMNSQPPPNVGAPGVPRPPRVPTMPNNPEEVFSKIQGLIDKCLQMTLTREQTMAFIEREVRVDPYYTALVWDKIVEQNPDFFRSYASRLRLKSQITMFNRLIDQRITSSKTEFDAIQMSRLESHNKGDFGSASSFRHSSLNPETANINTGPSNSNPQVPYKDL